MIRRVIVYFYICSCLLSYDPVKTLYVFPKNMYDFCGKHVRVFQKYNHVFKDDDNQWFTYSCYLHAYCLDLLSEIHTFAFDQFCSCYEMVKGNVFVHGRFCRIDCGRQRFFLPKGGTGVCFYIFIFIANKEPAAFISFQEIITPWRLSPLLGRSFVSLLPHWLLFL